ncbi:hypothetical protein BG004_004120 [Podila humilis]|nr:hypothetical protein BG004_004120 [Podila humilis]
MPHPSIATNTDPSSSSDPSTRRGTTPTQEIMKKDPSIVKSASAAHASISQNHYNEPGGLVKVASLDSYDDNAMDYAIETPIHPLAAAPPTHASSNSSHASRPPLPSPHQREDSYPSSSTPSLQPQQHQQLLKLKNEHGCSPTPSLSSPSNEAKDDADPYAHDHPGSSPVISHRSPMEDGSPRFSPSPAPPHEKNHLVVDTSSDAIHSGTSHIRTPRMQMQETMGTPTTPSTAIMTPDTASAPLTGTTNSSATTTSSSRRGSLRATTATLPRTALQEETVALFKKYKSLIPCAKCFNRDTIQRDGMSDGNLRFKCRPPVSMSLICNKSYSESKIRNMIAGVVYGYTLPDSGTPTTASADGSKSNVLAFPPPPVPTTKSSRRPSQKPVDTSSQNSTSAGNRMDQEDPRDQQMLEQDHRQRLQQQHQQRQHDDIHGSNSRRASVQPSGLHRPSAIGGGGGGDDSPMMDYDDATMLPPLGRVNRLQVPGTPPLDGDDQSLQRSHSDYALSGRGPSSLAQSSARQPQKLHHSRSHPNIGQQRHQQYLEHQEQMVEHRGSIGGYKTSPHGHQPYLQHPAQRSQVIRRESAPYVGSTERRFSHPATLKASNAGNSKYLPVGHTEEALSPALSSSSRSSPGREPVLQPSSGAMGDQDQNLPPTPSLGSLPQGYYNDKVLSPYQRRMSQPHPSNQRGGSAYSQLPGFSNTKQQQQQQQHQAVGHHYDRRGSELDEYHYSHREKYEKLNANTLKQYKSRMSQQEVSSSAFMPSSSSSSAHPSPQFENATSAHSLPVFSASMPSMNGNGRGGYGSSNGYHSPLPQGSARYQPGSLSSSSGQLYQSPSRRDYDPADPYAPESDPSMDDGENRQFARMRGSIKQPTGARTFGSGSHNHMYNMGSSVKDLDAALPKNTIKLTCFPSSVKSGLSPFAGSNAEASAASGTATATATTTTLETTDAMALRLDQHSKLVIEISQPRLLQSFRSLSTLRSSEEIAAASDPSALERTVRHTASQPNLLQRSSSSVLGLRRSASPDSMSFGSSKKRRADSVSANGRDMDDVALSSSSTPSSMAKMGTSSSSMSNAAASAAAAVVAAAAASAAASANSNNSGGGGSGSGGGSSTGVQLVGLDYIKQESSSSGGFGLGLSHTNGSSAVQSPTIEALAVASASSYVALEDQKELGIDYSLFTRVETAGWRILIPPNVTASFKSEDFGLLLRPKDDVNNNNNGSSSDLVEGEGEINQSEGAAIVIHQENKQNGAGGSVVGERQAFNGKIDKGKEAQGEQQPQEQQQQQMEIEQGKLDEAEENPGIAHLDASRHHSKDIEANTVAMQVEKEVDDKAAVFERLSVRDESASLHEKQKEQTPAAALGVASAVSVGERMEVEEEMDELEDD